MPIGTVGICDEDDLKYALRLYQATQANALKVEGAHLVSFIQKQHVWVFPLFLI